MFKNITSLRIRFALGFSILITFFLALAFLFIYVSFRNFRKEEFYGRLKSRALTTYNFLFEVEQIDHELLKVIDRNTLNSLHEEKILVFRDTVLVYNSIDDVPIRYVPELFALARQKGEYRTSQGAYEVLALHVDQEGDDHTIIASAYDTYGRNELRFLKWVMMVVYISSLLTSWVSTYLFVRRIIRPLESLKRKLYGITYNNLDARLPETGQGAEVDSLSSAFNTMLGRLQRSFDFQKDFVHYASHELRTPLAAMVSLTQNAMSKDMSKEDTQELLSNLFQQQKNLTEITNSLLVLSDNRYSVNNLDYPETRLDELVFKSVEIIKHLYVDAQIDVNLEGDLSNERSLLVHANEPLILMAFNNLLKNALLYSSDGKASIVIASTSETKSVCFINASKPFTADEEKNLFTPFFRAANALSVKGYGLGLPLVKQIVYMHNASIHYEYRNGSNHFRIEFLPQDEEGGRPIAGA